MFKIIFEDGEIFKGGKDLKNSKWNEIPDKSIKKIEYTLLEYTLYLENYESYNHLIKYGTNLFTHEKILINVTLLGRYNNKLYKFIFDIINSKLIIMNEIEKQTTTGWKKGLCNIIPTYKII